MDVLQVNGITKNFGDFTAVKEISFSIEEVKIFDLIGLNGVSKMTIICIIMIIISFIMVLSVVQNPNTLMAFWGSLIPFFTPIVMFGRITATDPALPSGFFLSIFIMLSSTGLLLWLSAKIYRVGILMYGKKPSLKEILKWLKY